MKEKTGRTAAELCGAVMGAGLASGREIASFFARFGPWGWLGVAAAAGVTAWLALGLMRQPGAAGMPSKWKSTWCEQIWKLLFGGLLTATGAAMLAAGGEVAALLLPFHGARTVGLVGMMLLAWRLAGKDTPMLAALSRGLLLCLMAVMVVGALATPERGTGLCGSGGAEGALYGLCYGGFNTALAAPVIAGAGKGLNEGEQRRCVLTFAGVLGLMLCCGHAVLLRHQRLMDAQLPFVALLSPLGKGGYVLGGASLGIAAVTTLVACVRGLRGVLQGKAIVALAVTPVIAAAGLEGIVGMAYPALGAACFLLLGAARLQNKTKT